MRLTRLFALAAPLAMLLPLSAHAAWPAGMRADFMKDCSTAAAQNIGEANAEKHCACGANVLDKNFTTDEIKQLMSKEQAPSAELVQKAHAAIASCKAQR